MVDNDDDRDSEVMMIENVNALVFFSPLGHKREKKTKRKKKKQKVWRHTKSLSPSYQSQH